MTSGAVLKKCDPVAYYDEFLVNRVFPDGRDVEQYRPISISPGVNWKHHRSVIVEHGDIVISLTGKLSLHRDNDEPNLKFRFRNDDRSKVNSNEQNRLESITDSLHYLAKENVFFERSEFDTEEPAFRWNLKVTITFFSSEGFILDAVLIGLNALFAQIRIPFVRYDWLKNLEKEEQTIDTARIIVSEKEFRRLVIKETPTFSAFGLYVSKHGAEGLTEPLLVADPPSDLAALCASTLEFVHLSGDRIILSTVQGSLSVPPAVYSRVAAMGASHHRNVSEALARFAGDQRLAGDQ
uniref:RNase_PH domain-containing protein n=1 Tax=Panagrellus redivivus TaxID=6233 RepID=A0A7E5A1N2_PANRE